MKRPKGPMTDDEIRAAWLAALGLPPRHVLEDMAAQLRKLGILAWPEPAPTSWGYEPGKLALYRPGAVNFSECSVEAIVEWFCRGGGREPQPIEPPLRPTIEDREAALFLLAWLSQGRSVPEA